MKTNVLLTYAQCTHRGGSKISDPKGCLDLELIMHLIKGKIHF